MNSKLYILPVVSELPPFLTHMFYLQSLLIALRGDTRLTALVVDVENRETGEDEHDKE